MRIWLFVYGLIVGSMALGGCDDSGGDPPAMSDFDCRNEGYGCGAGFECRQNGASGYECLPAEAGTGGASGTGGMPGAGGIPGAGGAEMGGQPEDGGRQGMGGGAGEGGGEASPCEGLEDGAVVVPGDRGQCEGVGGPCSQMGIQRWIDQVCRDGVLVDENRQGDCEQDTEGRILIEGVAGECAFADACVLMGARPRRDTVCREGLAVPEETMLPCERDTEGVVVSRGDFGPCGGFDDLCDLSGLRTRADVVCDAGMTTQVETDEACDRAPPGVVFEGETAGACVGPAGAVLALPAGALTIPEGAVIQPTPVWFSRTDEAAPDGYRALSPVFEITPADQVLARPVSLSLAFDGDLRRALIFWAADGGSFERAGGQFVDGRMVVTHDRFGLAFVGDGVDYAPAPDPTCVRLIQRYSGSRPSPAIVAVGFGVEDCRGRPVAVLAPEQLRVQEDGAPLPAEVTRRLTPPAGLQLFVNLALDLSDSTAPNLGALILAAKAFVRVLQVERRLPVQIAITTFAGGAVPTLWEAATRDTERLLRRLDALADHREDAPLTTNLNGAVVHALASVEESAAAFSDRNRGGAITREAVVVFTDGGDTAGAVPAAEMEAALGDSTATLLAVGLDSPVYDEAALAALAGENVFTARDVAGLTRAFEGIAHRAGLVADSTYVLGYCSPRFEGNHVVSVALAEAENRGRVEYAYDATGFELCDDLRDLDLRCGDHDCGGLACGACDDRTHACTEEAHCESFCDLDPSFGVEACDEVNPRGYVQSCDRPTATLCGDVCVRPVEDETNCGQCGRQCRGAEVCVAGDCNCPANWIGAACDACANAWEGPDCGTCPPQWDGENCDLCRAGWHGASCDQTQCGDGTRRADEGCDDGNQEAGDGCDPGCVVESGWRCDGDRCDPICGDGRVLGAEACDDGDPDDPFALADGTGCSVECTIEDGFECEGSGPGSCNPVCGDGVVVALDLDGLDLPEQCDDGDDDWSNGCTPTCLLGDRDSCVGAAQCDPGGTQAVPGDLITLVGEGTGPGNLGAGVGITARAVYFVDRGAFARADSVDAAGSGDLYEARFDEDGAYTAIQLVARAPEVGAAVGDAPDRALPVVDLVPSTIAERELVVVSRAFLGGRLGDWVPGTAFVHERTGDGAWVSAQLEDPDEWSDCDPPADPDRPEAVICHGSGFGSVVAASGDDIFVANARPDPDDPRAEVTIFSRRAAGDWVRNGRFSGRSETFGRAMAADGDWLAISETNGQRVFIYERDPAGFWAPAGRVSGAGSDTYGMSLALAGEFLAVGDGVGEVSVYRRTLFGDWPRVQRISAGMVPHQVDISPTGALLVASVGQVASFRVGRDGSVDFLGRMETASGPDLAQGAEARVLVTSVAVGANGSIYGAPGVGEPFDAPGRITSRAWSSLCEPDGRCVCRLGADGLQCDERPTCGDGVVQQAEACDDGNENDGDGCAGCRFANGWTCVGAGDDTRCTPVCGDGILRGDEPCDDGELLDGDGCAADCTVEPGWTCDADALDCSPICGDGLLRGNEACDDGDLVPANGCSSLCFVEEGWRCAGEGPNACSPICGDGLRVGAEECDDEVPFGDDGCSAQCRVNPGWECQGTGRGSCAAICGDGLVVGPERCDDRNDDESDGCESDCLVSSGWTCQGAGPQTVCDTICGDRIRAGDEGCDDGNLDDADGCDSNCTPTACGNGVRTDVPVREQCDDGDPRPGDGCDDRCRVESRWQCSTVDGEASVCVCNGGWRGLACNECAPTWRGENCDDFGGFASLAAADDYTCGLTAQGIIHCWGDDPSRFQELPAAESFSQLSGGAEFLCGLRTDGTVGCWGRCLSGICDPPGFDDFTAVSAGRGHACGLRTDGTIVCWGANGAGQTDVLAGNYRKLALGYYHSCGLGVDGVITCWGRDAEGQRAPLADPEFAAGFQDLAAGGNYTCGVRVGGQPVCFGQRQADWEVFGVETPGQAHFLAAGDDDVCIVRPDFTAYCSRDAILLGDARVTTLAAGRSHVCGLALDGATVCWGSNGDGQSTVPAFAATAPPVCGNGRVEPAGGEACDDRNEIDGDGCTHLCQLADP